MRNGRSSKICLPKKSAGRGGFTAALVNQMERAGLESAVEAWTQVVILAAKRR